MSTSFPKDILKKAYILMCTAREMTIIYEDNKDSLRLYTIVSGLKLPAKRLKQLAG